MAPVASKELAKEIPNIIRLYKDGSVERLIGSPYEPPSLQQNPQSKDIILSRDPAISARIFLPKPTQPTTKFPILVYFHAGGFCVESAFSFFCHRYLNSLTLESQALVVSIEYRQASEYYLPAAYEDSWEALQWVASRSFKNGGDPWILDHGDVDRLFIGGDSAGANIVHNIALRAGIENLRGNVRILGAFLGFPFFWGSNPVGNEKSEDHDKKFPRLTWDFVYPSAPYGVDNPMFNPASPASPTDGLCKLGCSRVLVYVAGKDEMRERGVWYLDLVRESGWKGDIEELIEFEEEDHVFHILNPHNHNSQIMIKHLASFLNK